MYLHSVTFTGSQCVSCPSLSRTHNALLSINITGFQCTCSLSCALDCSQQRLALVKLKVRPQGSRFAPIVALTAALGETTIRRSSHAAPESSSGPQSETRTVPVVCWNSLVWTRRGSISTVPRA